MSIDYNWVAQFVRVVRAGSFTAAAAEARLPKSSLSRTVTNLEAELGVRLLHRTTRRLALTDVGQAYFESVRGAFDDVDAATDRALDHDVDPHGVVHVAAPSDFHGLAEEVAKFRRKYPRIAIDVHLASRYVDLVGEGVDLAIRVGPLESSSLVARKIGDVDIGLMASASYLRRQGRPKSVDELPGHDWILFRSRTGSSTLHLTGADGDRTIDVRGSLNADEMAFCKSACEAGAGIANLPLTFMGPLERVLPRWITGTSQVSLVMPASRLVPRRVALLRDYFIEHLPKYLRDGGLLPRARSG